MGETPGHRETVGGGIETVAGASTRGAEGTAEKTDTAGEVTPHTSPLYRTRPRQGRPFNTSTKLGKLIKARGMNAREVAHMAGMSERTLTELLAGRRRVSPINAAYFAAILNCDPSDVIE